MQDGSTGVPLHWAPDMKPTLLTGLNGTLAPVLAAEIRARGGDVLGWDRSAVSPDDEAATRDFIRRSEISALVHCGMGSPQWAQCMAECCASRGIPFLFTSSVSVFGPHQVGPFGVETEPEPTDDYGRYKLECERRVLAAHPRAVVVRLGWQMALGTEGNQMVAHLSRQHSEQGVISASINWFQACSFLEDTASVLADLLDGARPGLYHLDGNPGWSFHEIVEALNRMLGFPWCVRATEDVRLNNLMRDPRLRSASIAARLGC